MAAFGKELMAKARFPAAADWLDADIRSLEPGERYDLVVASYVLGEMTGPDREAVAMRLWELTGGILLLVEPGTPAAFGQLLELRRLLAGRGAHVAAPCPHSGPCPLPEGDWCHFTCRVSRSKLHRQLKGGDAPYEDEKYAYLALCREEVAHTGHRVLRHPLVESGRVSLRLCTPEAIEETVVTRSAKERFKAARKLNSGDLWLA